MFNQLTPAEVVSAIGATAREAARSDGPRSEFERDQLMSTYSATRHLAVELASYEPELRRFIAAVVDTVRNADVTADGEELIQMAGRLEASADPPAVGAAICELLARLRDDLSPEAGRLRAEIHAALRRLADREVDLLAEALG